MTVHEQPFFTKTDGAEPAVTDTQIYQVFLGPQCPALAQGHVVLIGAAGISVALDTDGGITVFLEKVV